MRHRILTIGTGLFLVVALANAGEPTPGGQRITQLVAQLGSDSFHERERARKDIEAIGTPALAALCRASHTGDLETARRAADLIRVIEERDLTATLLTPKKLHLKITDMPVLQAVEKLAKLSGYALRVDGDRTGLLEKTVTLDTGEVTFWQAIDQLGARAGIIEKLTVASIPGDANVMSEVWVDLARPAMRRLVRRGPPPLPPLRMARLPAKELKQGDEPRKDPDPSPPQIVPGRVVLMPGLPGRQHVSYAGAARVLLNPVKAVAAAQAPSAGKFYDLVLEASAEPGLLGFTLVGVPTVTRAVDEHDQALSFVIDPPSAVAPRRGDVPIEALEVLNEWQGAMMPAQGGPRGVTLRLQQGARPAKRLKELSGTLTAQVLVPKTTLVAVDDILNANGKTFDIKGGGKLLIDAIEKVESATSAGAYRLTYKLEPGTNGTTTAVARGGRTVYVTTGPIGGDAVPVLLDAKGRPLTVVNTPVFSQENVGQMIRMTGNVEFQIAGGVDQPTRLVLTGTYRPTIVVPFRFVNVPLP
jgi:hypothetical protein